MSEFTALRITRANQEGMAIDPPWLRLEQVIPAETQQYPGVGDIYQAWMYGAAGLSALQLRPDGCPVEFDGSVVRFFLGFYVWPSNPAMRYQLTSTIGEFGPAQQVRQQKTFHLFADNAPGISTPYYLDGVSASWESPCSDRYGEQITPPIITDRHTHFLFGRETFGGLKISGSAVGYYHVLTVEIDKAAPDGGESKISNLEPTVTAAWQLGDESGVEGEVIDESQQLSAEQLRLTVPHCVEDILTACPNDPTFGEKWCKKKTDVQVYFSTCSGEVLETRKGKNPRKYCTKVDQGNYAGWLATQTNLSGGQTNA